MTELEITGNPKKNSLDMNVYAGRKRKARSVYYNVIDRDAKKLAQILIDLEFVSDIPVFEAVQIYLTRREKKDWFSL